jgi:hypothetical protein
VTVTLALNVVKPLLAVTFTLIVPPVTIFPAHEELVVLLVTVLLFESLKLQFENVAPVGALVTLHVVLLPRVADEQLSFMTLTPPPGLSARIGHDQDL